MIKFNNIKKEPFRLDLIPMINVVFLLLIFFMLTSNAMTVRKEVTLPEARTSDKIEKENVVVSILPDGSFALGNQSVTDELLLQELEKKLKGKKEKLVQIQADKGIEFELFGKVIYIARQAGAVDFILATNSPDAEGA